jgi:hypothetical protein
MRAWPGKEITEAKTGIKWLPFAAADDADVQLGLVDTLDLLDHVHRDSPLALLILQSVAPRPRCDGYCSRAR